MNPTLGFCSWSVQPRSVEDLVSAAEQLDVKAVQLALDPIRTGDWSLDETRAALKRHNLQIASGMMSMVGEDYSTLESIRRTGGIVPDETWEQNLQAARGNIELCRELDVALVTFHAGFLPESSDDPNRAKLLDRLLVLRAAFADAGIQIALETGQETGATLHELLSELSPDANFAVGVNFDPANMILYGMGDPVATLETLAPFVRQIHVKDALPSQEPGQWGTEVPMGSGSVDWDAFFATLDTHVKPCSWIIEREAGDERLEDIRTAYTLVRAHWERRSSE